MVSSETPALQIIAVGPTAAAPAKMPLGATRFLKKLVSVQLQATCLGCWSQGPTPAPISKPQAQRRRHSLPPPRGRHSAVWLWALLTRRPAQPLQTRRDSSKPPGQLVGIPPPCPTRRRRQPHPGPLQKSRRKQGPAPPAPQAWESTVPARCLLRQGPTGNTSPNCPPARPECECEWITPCFCFLRKESPCEGKHALSIWR